MTLEFKGVRGYRQGVLSLHEMINVGAPSELSCSRLEAILHIRRLHALIAARMDQPCFPRDVCWVGTAKSLEEVHERYTVTVAGIISYLDRCASPATVTCIRDDGDTDEVVDEFIVFSPEPWITWLHSLGLAWVPRRGAMPIEDIPPELLEGGLEPTAAADFPYTTCQIEAMRKAAALFWVDFDRSRPPLQKTVSSFIAEQLRLDGPNRTTNTLAAAIRPEDVPHER